MNGAFARALELLFAGDPLLTSILRVTLTMTLFSSITALLFGAPYGVLLASVRFPGRRTLRITSYNVCYTKLLRAANARNVALSENT